MSEILDFTATRSQKVSEGSIKLQSLAKSLRLCFNVMFDSKLAKISNKQTGNVEGTFYRTLRAQIPHHSHYF